jgi:hypothetical protein
MRFVNLSAHIFTDIPPINPVVSREVMVLVAARVFLTTALGVPAITCISWRPC